MIVAGHPILSWEKDNAQGFETSKCSNDWLGANKNCWLWLFPSLWSSSEDPAWKCGDSLVQGSGDPPGLPKLRLSYWPLVHRGHHGGDPHGRGHVQGGHGGGAAQCDIQCPWIAHPSILASCVQYAKLSRNLNRLFRKHFSPTPLSRPLQRSCWPPSQSSHSKSWWQNDSKWGSQTWLLGRLET